MAYIDVERTRSEKGCQQKKITKRRGESEWVARKIELSGIFGRIGTKTVVLGYIIYKARQDAYHGSWGLSSQKNCDGKDGT